MNWALVVMSCIRLCEPQYVELYASKAECLAAKPEDKSGWSASGGRYLCVAAVKGDSK